jgi:hypothetical protein
MFTQNKLQSIGFILSLLTSTLLGQQMPQDYWKNYGESVSVQAGESFLGVAVAADGLIYVGIDTVSGQTVGVFDDSLTELRRWGTFSNIRGIAVNSSNEVHVFDLGAATSIQVYDTIGSFVRQWGVHGEGEGEFSSARSGIFDNRGLLAVDSYDKVLAVDPNHFKVHVYNSSGGYLESFGEEGDFLGQWNRIPVSITVVGNGQIVIGLKNEGGLSFWDSSFTFLSSLTRDDVSGNLFGTTNLSALPDSLVVRNFNGGADRYEFDILSSSAKVFSFSSGYLGGTGFESAGIASLPNGDLVLSTSVDLRLFRRSYHDADHKQISTDLPHPYTISVSQRSGTTLVDIDYQVVDTDSATVETAMVLYTGAPSLSTLLLPETLEEGTVANLGVGITSNETHRVTWNAGVDWDVDVGDIRVEVLAKDERGLFPIHWTTIPGEEAPDLTVSANPITNAELYSLWVWLIAKKDSAIALVSGQVVGGGGSYDGETLYDGSNTTAEGRAFLLERLNVAAYNGEYVQTLP